MEMIFEIFLKLESVSTLLIWTSREGSNNSLLAVPQSSSPYLKRVYQQTQLFWPEITIAEVTGGLNSWLGFSGSRLATDIETRNLNTFFAHLSLLLTASCRYNEESPLGGNFGKFVIGLTVY